LALSMAPGRRTRGSRLVVDLAGKHDVGVFGGCDTPYPVVVSVSGPVGAWPKSMPALPPGWNQARRLYLDQQHWVRLSKENLGKDTAGGSLLESLHGLVNSGSVVVPLSMAHWAETWHRGDPQSRWDLANVMWRVSRLISFAPFHELRTAGIDHQLHERLGRPVWPREIQPLGVGVNHAWASPHGRLRYVEWADGKGGEGDEADPPDLFKTFDPYLYEWLHLAGGPMDLRIDGLDWAQFRRAGDEGYGGSRG
jgi:hypothetical protein